MKKFSDFIKKSAEPQKKEPASNVIKGRFKIAKSDDDKHLAFGWANVAIRADGEEIEDCRRTSSSRKNWKTRIPVCVTLS